ncbi:MAG: DUF3047 domain-containing protein [Deltaproteobacteria bacterium]|nr:DUF3047 domain-containing protein [Deltaproteobacteria bacterium]
MKNTFFLTFAFFLFINTASGESVSIGNFDRGDLSGWEEKEFAGKTDYRIVYIEARKVLEAKSNDAASGMFKELEVDLEKTPYLNWTWRVENIFDGLDEKSKAGDDYPARVYVVFSGGLFFWKTKALNYVWSSSQTLNSNWPNAFTSNAMMIAVESGPDNLGKWLTYKRNIREDYRKLFGDDVKNVDAVAIMTDTDNAHGKAKAYYGEIYFSSE